MLEVFLDALLDSLKTFPFLFLIYLLMEVIESAEKKENIEKALSGAGAPVVASFLGVIPECGFSVMCAKLFDKGLIKIGTLVAAFIAVSDEGLIALISSGAGLKDILLLVSIKLLYAILVGELLNVLFKNFGQHVCPEKDECIECGEKHEKAVDKFLLHPLFHASKIFLYILVLNFIFGTIIFLIGEDALKNFMNGSLYFQPVLAVVVGLIPNCASSMVLSQAFMNGALSFSGLIAGLSANAGIGLLILFKNTKNIKKNLIILGIMFISGVLLGYITLLIGL